MGQTENLEEADDMDLDNTVLVNGKRVGYITKYDSIEDIPDHMINQPYDLVLDPFGKPTNMTPAFSEETEERLYKWLDSERGQATMNKHREELAEWRERRKKELNASNEETAGE